MNTEQLKATCTAILERQLGERLAAMWWKSPNHSFNNLTPSDQFQIDPLSVLEYISAHLLR